MNVSKKDIIHQWKLDAEQIGIDINTVWTQWTHGKALILALEKSPRASAHPASFYIRVFVFMAIVDQIILGARRQIDKEPREHSLKNFLGALKDQPNVYSRNDCIATFLDRAVRCDFDEQLRSSYVRQAEALYAEVADDSGEAMDQMKIKRDISDLYKLCKKMERIASTRIAHNDRNKPDFEITIETLDQTINGLRHLIRKYARLFDGGGEGGGESDIDEIFSLYKFAWLE